MSNGPDPALLNDWFTWGGVLFVAACIAAVWVTLVILLPRERYPHGTASPVSFPVSPCAPHGHKDET